MSSVPTQSVYRDAGCVFRIDRKSKILTVNGTPEDARLSILKLRKEGLLPKELRAIIFLNAEFDTLVTGIELTLFLITRPVKPKAAPRTFRELVQTTSD